MSGANAFREARNLLLNLREDYAGAASSFRWPRLNRFNWAADHFDTLIGSANPALRIVNDAGNDVSISFDAMARRSHQVANFLCDAGVRRGDRVLLMLGNVVELWETMLAAIRMGVVVVPATTLLTAADVSDRLQRASVSAIVVDSAFADRFAGSAEGLIRICVGKRIPGWIPFEQTCQAPETKVHVATLVDEPLIIYFTSGTTAKAKMVVHTHASYPVGHLSTMYWLGLQPGDLHLNLSSPGWAKHAWSCLFAPWNAGATVLAYQYERFSATALLDKLVQCGVTTFCAPPTVWRMMIQEDLARWPVVLREAGGAGEPLNPEIIATVRDGWGLTIRDGFGQTESTAQIGNPPGQPLKPGSMGRPLPGYRIVLLDSDDQPAAEGEICLPLNDRPMGLMHGYLDDEKRTLEVTRGGYYHTGDIASRDEDGYLTYVGRMDDVFKSSDYRISPFELESTLLEHPAVAEAAVVPSPDPIRLSVPKAFVTLASGFNADAEMARSIFMHIRQRVSPFKRVRCIEFGELPKTISGKIRRVDLRKSESNRAPQERKAGEYWESDLSGRES